MGWDPNPLLCLCLRSATTSSGNPGRSGRWIRRSRSRRRSAFNHARHVADQKPNYATQLDSNRIGIPALMKQALGSHSNLQNPLPMIVGKLRDGVEVRLSRIAGFFILFKELKRELR